MKQDRLRSIICWILAFFLAAVLLAGVLCVFGRVVTADRTALFDSMQETDYAETLTSEIREKWDNLAAITGIQERTELLNLVTEQRVAVDSQTYYENAYLGQSVLDTDALRREVRTFVEEYVAGTDPWFVNEAELQQNITDLVDACIDEYALSVKIKLMPNVLGQMEKIASLLEKGMWVCAVMTLLLTVFLFFLQVRRRETLRYLFCAVAPTPILLLAACRFVKAEAYIYRLPMADSALKGMLEQYLEKILAMLQYIGEITVWVAMGVLGLYLVICMVQGIQNHHRSKRLPCEKESGMPQV